MIVLGIASGLLWALCYACHVWRERRAWRSIDRKVGHVWIVSPDGTAERLRDRYSIDERTGRRPCEDGAE